MIEFGKTLRTAREAKGLTIADIAERTHMMSSVIANLENEDFTKLPAPIYGRGFVKLYCEAVGIDAAPMTAEFMEIYNGNREPAIRERTVSPPPPREPSVEQNDTSPAVEKDESFPGPIEMPTAEEPEPVDAPTPPANEQLDLFASEQPILSRSEPASPEPMTVPEPVPTEPPKRKHAFARYAVPFREHAAEIKTYFPTAGRLSVIVILLALLVWGLVAGVRALYRATGPADTPERTTSLQTAAEASVPADTPRPPSSSVKTSRTPLDIPPLYVD